ncbi:signal peptide peptidase SppA [Hyalangium rubrum]|uniref:Signal peptide peptidase SppA n=1 Tax=Hyalangium rubrum TaxID=3103134 RepID=A0ABU5H4K5_9BACT|nr:signal peptide peptidase SppA [Hyalangium sp. s54d21]MDY7227712.1 signal peptide peptidase SppA [Hyalangium sp. s54d21]
MKDFLKTLVACLIALGIFAGGAFFLLVGFVAVAGAAKPTVPSKAVLVLDLDMNLLDRTNEAGPSEMLQSALQGEETRVVALATVVAALDRATEDERIVGLFMTGNLNPVGYGSGHAALRELRGALQRFKAKKPVWAYNLEWGKHDYFLGAVATTLVVNPAGHVELNGLASEPTFFGDAFQKYGIEVQVTRVGKYKSAVEPFILNRMSDPSREQLQKLLNDMWTEWKAALSADRKQTPEAIQAVADEKGLLEPEEAQEAGLVDRVAAYDEVLEELKKLSGTDEKEKTFHQIPLDTYAELEVRPKEGKHRVAVVYAEGVIVNGEGRHDQAGGDRISRELRKLRQDEDVKAVVLRVNSPGGSAGASDLIQREVIITRKVKPVIISMGSYAASGGYWISAYGDRIFAQPTTITGSIGVFGLLPNVQKLANTHGVTFDSVQTAKMANPATLTRPKTEAELARIQHMVDRVYEEFLTKVAEGRQLPRDKVHEIGQGRVWSGEEARKLGLVDEVGGLQEAAKFAAEKAGVGSDYRMDLPERPKPFFQQLMESMDKKQKPRAHAAVERVWSDLQRQVEMLRAFNDPAGVYAIMPVEVTVD